MKKRENFKLESTHPQGIWWNFDGEKIVHVEQDAQDYESDDEHQMLYMTEVTFHELTFINKLWHGC
jgi:hypothetical protein